MKKLFTITCYLFVALAASAARADTEIVTVSDGEAAWNHRGGKVAQIHVLSSVASGKATLKSESKLWGTRDEITDLSTSNFVWTVVWSNGVDVVTNVSTVAPYPLPSALVSATSNWVVRAYAVTNTFPCVTLCVTNALSSEITCSSGVGTSAPADKYVAPGDPIFFEGTAKGRMKVILTR